MNRVAGGGSDPVKVVQREFERQLDHIMSTGYRRFVLAFSGGLDSTVLVKAAVVAREVRDIALVALHVDHSLSNVSSQWAEHCARVARELEVDYELVRIDERPPQGASIEAWARGQRYAAFERSLNANSCLLTAHHADDQMETVLLRLLSGSGPHGLSAIRTFRCLGQGFLARPLLRCHRRDLRAYAVSRQLHWVEDESNRDFRFVRNRLRGSVMPALESAVPSARKNLLQMVQIQRELAGLLDTLADSVLDAGGLSRHQVSAASVLAADERLRPYILRRWLERAGVPLPRHSQLHELLHKLLDVRLDAGPRVRIGMHEVRRYRGRLYLLSSWAWALPAMPLPLELGQTLTLPWGEITLKPSVNGGIAAEALARGALSVRFRGGGERCQPHDRPHTHTLKKLFQEWAVPPWERQFVPLLYCDGVLIAVADHCVCSGFAAVPGAAAFTFEWRSVFAESGC